MPPVPPATDKSPKGLQGDGRHSAQSDQTQQHTQTTRQHTHTHTPSRPENARKTRTRCISIMARTRCISIMARLMAWSNAFITFERPSPPPTPWRRNRAQRCAGTRGHDEPSQLNPALLVPGRSTRTPPCSPIAGHNVRRGQRRRSRGQRRQPRRRPRGQRRGPSRSQRMRVHGASRSMRVHGASRSMRVHGASRGATRSLAASSASRSSRSRSQASSALLNKAGAEATAKRTAVTYNNNSTNNNDDDKIVISDAYGNYWHSEIKKNNSNANGYSH